MTTRTCPRCDRPIDAGTLCQPCLDRLTSDLASIPDAITELHTQLARLARTDTSLIPRPHPDHDPDWHHPDMLAIAIHPLPYHPGASEALDLLRSVLTGWTRDTTPDHTRLPHHSLRAMAHHLAAQDWRNHPAAHEFADELHWTLERINACIDTTAGWRYLGPCGCTTQADDGTEVPCPGDVYLVGNRPPKCRDCGATHAINARLEWIAELAADQLVTATTAAGALSAWGEHIKPELIRKWAERGRLAPKGHDPAGHPLYAFSACRTLAAETMKRRDTTPGA